DELIVAQTNETEERSGIAKKKKEAWHSRIIVMTVPYNLRVREEEHIYEKMIRESDVSKVHIAPHTLRVAAMFTILTRLKDPKGPDMYV
ncbi:protein prkA, partial [Bacillus mycoides]|nr:protein prkA [Bacillus mycoides]